MSAQSTTDTMLGIIPAVFVAGVALKVTEGVFSARPKRRKAKKDVYSRGYSGDFSNVGW